MFAVPNPPWYTLFPPPPNDPVISDRKETDGEQRAAEENFPIGQLHWPAAELLLKHGVGDERPPEKDRKDEHNRTHNQVIPSRLAGHGNTIEQARCQIH